KRSAKSRRASSARITRWRSWSRSASSTPTRMSAATSASSSTHRTGSTKVPGAKSPSMKFATKMGKTARTTWIENASPLSAASGLAAIASTIRPRVHLQLKRLAGHCAPLLFLLGGEHVHRLGGVFLVERAHLLGVLLRVAATLEQVAHVAPEL